MPRFYFRVCNGEGEIPDEEGLEADSHSAARRIALDSIRSMVAEDARKGVIDLAGYIAIEDRSHNLLAKVDYAEAFELRGARVKGA